MDIESLAHTKWNCKYHIVFAPKYRKNNSIYKIKRRYRKNLTRVISMKEFIDPFSGEKHKK